MSAGIVPRSVTVILHLLTIKIGVNPNIAKFGSLQFTWHGIGTAVVTCPL